MSVVSLGLRQPIKMPWYRAQPECQHNQHDAGDQRIYADQPDHRQRARRGIEEKRHAEKNRDDAADNQHPFIA